MNKRFLAKVALFIAINSYAFAQLPVSLSGSLNGGLLIPQSTDLKGKFSDSHNFPLSKTSYNVGGKLRYNIAPLPINIVGLLSYNSLTDNSDLTIVGGPNGPVTTNYTFSFSILSAGVGIEYSIDLFPIFKPYLGSDLVSNIISGSGGDSKHYFPDAKMNSTTRFGINFEAGVLMELPSLPISFDIGLKYCLANAIGKKFTSVSYPSDGYGWLPQNAVYYLNDAKNPNDSYDHDRSIDFVTINIGIVFKII